MTPPRTALASGCGCGGDARCGARVGSGFRARTPWPGGAIPIVPASGMPASAGAAGRRPAAPAGGEPGRAPVCAPPMRSEQARNGERLVAREKSRQLAGDLRSTRDTCEQVIERIGLRQRNPMEVEPTRTYVVVERRLDAREECAARVLCRTYEGLAIAVCGTPGQMGNLESVRHANVPSTMTIEADAMQRSRTTRIDFREPLVRGREDGARV